MERDMDIEEIATRVRDRDVAMVSPLQHVARL